MIAEELLGYVDILLGREEPPVESPYLDLAEVAAAFHGRAREIEMLIYNAEAEGSVRRGDPYYKLRNGSLKSFIELSKRMYDLGSRRLTQESLLTQQRLDMGDQL